MPSEQAGNPDDLLNSLPRHSAWPARLLGLEPWTQLVKSRAEVLREFENEKWGPLLARVRGADRPVTVRDVESWRRGEHLGPAPRIVAGSLVALTAEQDRGVFLDTVEASVLRYSSGVTCLAELGAGYGGTLLELAHRGVLDGLHLVAGELTPSGRALIHHLAAADGLKVTTLPSDLEGKPPISGVDLEGATILTAYAAFYLPTDHSTWALALRSLGPKVVVQLEPCYQHYAQDTLLGQLQRRYMEVNGYCRSLLTTLRQHQADGLIDILEETPNVHGSNPFLPASILAWRPRR